VRHILSAVHQVAKGRETRVYCVDGRFVDIGQACQTSELAAASNWHALARFACRYVKGEFGLLIDAGSTTTDIVPLGKDRPRPSALNDTDRLVARELVYTGVGRTPVCAITRDLPWRVGRCPVAAEVFATAADAYVVLGELAEQPDAKWTADGRPLTKEFARERLARMICADASQFTMSDAEAAAATVREAQIGQLDEAVRQVVGTGGGRPECLVVSGMGEFLAREAGRSALPRTENISLSERLGGAASEVAPAYALAVLAREAG
jgi:(4-(4-[2-(gamma-L-glutamylamino)ethyl]phenoxymethyl)furan-2-yl)methanamine synthase